MSKTTAKLEHNLINALTLACEEFKRWDIGFDWLTHTVSHNRFPDSLVVSCVFLTQAQMQQVLSDSLDARMRKEIQTRLLKAGIRPKDIRRNVRMDNEQDCAAQDGGNWEARLQRFRG